MLNLINTLSLASALTLTPISENININVNVSGYSITINSTSNLKKTNDENDAYNIYLSQDKSASTWTTLTIENYNTQYKTTAIIENKNTICIGYSEENIDIARYKNLNKIVKILSANVYEETIKEFSGNGTYTMNIQIRSKNNMEELLTALTTAVQSAVSIFVEGFGGLTQIFYNGTEITFIGGILIVGLAVMFLMMFLRWIVSFVKGI